MATVLTQVGEEYIVDQLMATSADYVGWGIGNGGGKGSSDLVNPATEARSLATRTEALADKIQWVAIITCAGAGKTISEAGVFDGAGTGSPPSGGAPLLVYGDFTGIPLSVGDQIQFTIQLEIT